jgi:hypothetical protein
MKNLRNLLERFTNSLNKDSLFKETVVDSIRNQTSITLNPDNISLKEGVLSIEAGATQKNEMRMKESMILNELKDRKVPVSKILYR